MALCPHHLFLPCLPILQLASALGASTLNPYLPVTSLFSIFCSNVQCLKKFFCSNITIRPSLTALFKSETAQSPTHIPQILYFALYSPMTVKVFYQPI